MLQNLKVFATDYISELSACAGGILDGGVVPPFSAYAGGSLDGGWCRLFPLARAVV